MELVQYVYTHVRDGVGRVFIAGLLTVLGSTAVIQSSALAQGAGDLVVAPTRVVFEGRERTTQLTLLNRGSATATYRISVTNMRMKDDGGVLEIDKPDPGQNFAGKLVRYSPRQVTLKPGAAQAVRVLLRKPKGLADGEYRSHLLFRGVPDDAGQSVEQTANDTDIAIRLVPIYGISIPVIVRHGKTELKIAMSDLKIEAAREANKPPLLKFKINREGNRSSFGDLVATYNSGSDEGVIIGQINRLALYAPNSFRTVEMQLRVPDGVTLKGGKLNLTYSTIADAGGKLMAKTELSIP